MIRTAVLGATGYTGAELLGLLAGHPDASIEAVVAGSNAGRTWESLYPARGHLFRGEITSYDPDRLAGLDVVALALPHGESAPVARDLRGRVGRIIDLSGDLRLPDAAAYRSWYGREHPAPELLGAAAYGLPELFGADLPTADLIACAGCYATVALLAVAPALAIEAVGSSVTISAVSGTSGAGRRAEVALSFSEVFGDVRPYRVGAHQHAPEIRQGLERFSSRQVYVTFVPHLVPVERGILASAVLPLRDPVDQGDVLERYRARYEDAPFVRVLDPTDRLPALRNVVGTNFCEVAPVVDETGRSLVVVGAIDNLVKGAAGQAVQVLNLCHGLPETRGLLTAGTAP